MKPKLTTALLPLFLVASCSITFFGNEKASREGSIQHTASTGITNIRIEGFNGSIALVPADGGLEVSGLTSAYATGTTQEEAQKRLGQMRWSFRESGNTLYLDLSRPDGGANNAGGSLQQLSVPSAWKVDVDTSNGNVKVEPGFNTVLIRTSNGNVDANGHGKMRIKSSNGNIQLSGRTQDFNVRSSNGNIEVNLEGDWSGMGNVDTSDGKITVRCTGTLDCSLRANTSNGKVYAYGPPIDSGEGTLVLDTSNADINVTHKDS
ncbi:MAG: DUF4097 family beta strand repeat-containing protein [Planctomycetota bacterium]|jgi:hypothetical protein|nr:DUF4097 family beta strand repeat-containing protein [Planctomycetota bacterium]